MLTPQEADHLFTILRKLRDQGTTRILITHKLREILAITDQVSIMRRGEMVARVATRDTNKEELAELMVGRKVRLTVDKGDAAPGQPQLSVKNLSYVDAAGVTRVKSVSFDVRRGEVVGIAGVSGNGQSELLSLLGGILQPSEGEFWIGAHQVSHAHPVDPRGKRGLLGLGHVPEDRHKMGLINRFEAQEAFILGYHQETMYNQGLLQTRRRSWPIARRK